MISDQSIQYINNRSWRESRLGLSRMRELMRRLGDPQRALKFVHIAGTNGKGSTAVMLASVLRAAGYRTGLNTSPFIHRFNERIQVDGVPISDAELNALTDFVRPHADAMDDHPTEFELVTAIALVCFHRRQCDIVVLEVGLGGRLDATNVIDAPLLAIITAIGLDHTRELGETVEKIAMEKAGIIKSGGEVVLYPQSEAVHALFEKVCRAENARLLDVDMSRFAPLTHSLAGQSFDFGPYACLGLSLLGNHQLLNAATVVTAALRLAQLGYPIPEHALRSGLWTAHWPGRFEVLSRSPVFVVDGGHNPQCARAIAENLAAYFPGKQVTFVLGVMADKDYRAMADHLAPYAAQFVTVTPPNDRALPAAALAEALSDYGKPTKAYGTIHDALRAVLRSAQPDEVIIAMGSLYMVGEIRSYFGCGFSARR